MNSTFPHLPLIQVTGFRWNSLLQQTAQAGLLETLKFDVKKASIELLATLNSTLSKLQTNTKLTFPVLLNDPPTPPTNTGVILQR